MKNQDLIIISSFLLIYLANCQITCPNGFSNCQSCSQNIIQGTSNVCTQCSTSYFISAPALCIVCALNCASCSTSATNGCTTCNSGYYLVAGQCLSCSSTTATQVGGISYTGIAGCSACTSPAGSITSPVCTACQGGYTLGGTPALCSICQLSSSSVVGCNSCTAAGICQSCSSGNIIANAVASSVFTCATTGATDIANCFQQAAGGAGSCAICQAGYYLSSSTSCLICATGCSICSASATCTSCQSGYFLSGSTCTACSTSCQACTSASACTLCNNGFYLTSAAACAACSALIPNCQSCNAAGTVCLMCSSGNFLAPNGQCMSGTLADPKCWVANSTSFCLQCLNGYTTTIGCSQCLSNCANCSSLTSCLNCTTGYGLSLNGTCLVKASSILAPAFIISSFILFLCTFY